MKLIAMYLSCLVSQCGFGQCLISQGNMFLDYQVSQCNGFSFQSAVGATLIPYGECSDHSYVSVFTDGSTITRTNHSNPFNKIRIFPNPVHDRLSLIMQDPETDFKVEIINALGNVIHKFSMQAYHTQISMDVTHLMSGFYYLKLLSSSGQQKTFSFTKSSF